MAPAGLIFANYWRKHANANAVIVLSCLALIGIVWAVTIERVSFERDDTIIDAARENANLVIAFEEHTIRTLKGIDQAVLFVKNQYQEHGLKLNIGGMIESGALDASLFNFIGITDERGNVVLGSHEFKPVNVADRESFKFHRRNNDTEMFIGKLNMGRITQQWAMPMSHRINKTDGSFGGMVYAAVVPEYFTRFYQRADLEEQGLVMLIGLDGTVRARRAGQKSSFGEDMRGAKLFMEQTKSRNGSFLSTGKEDGVTRFISFRTLTQYPLIVAVGASEAETLASFHERERRYYLTAGLASTMIIIFAAFMTAALSRRKRALDSLAESEARYRAIFDQAAVGIAVTTPRGRFIEANAKLGEMTGYTSAELCTLTKGDIIVTDDFDETKRDRARVLAGELRDLVSEARYVKKDRSVGWSSLSLSIVRSSSGEPQYFISLFADITERKLAEETARASENRLRLALSNFNMAVFHQDRTLRYTWMYQPQMGYLPEQVIGHTDAELLPPEVAHRVTELKRRVIEQGEIVHEEVCVAAKDGTFFYDLTAEPLRETGGAIIGLTGVSLDITERKRAEQTALEQFKLAETFFNHSVSCLAVLDRNFNFLRVNEAYARAAKRDIGEFAGCNHFDLYPSDAKAIFEEVVRTRKPFETFERSFVYPDQPERGVTYWDWTLVPILDQQDEVQYLVFSLNEVTERKRAQNVLEQSLQRVQALSERVMKIQQEERASIARELHDELGQTLTALKVNLQMLEPYCVGGEAEDHLTEALMIAGRSLGQVRGMMLNLRPLGLEDLGLAVVLESHLAKQSEVAGWDSQFEATLAGRLRPELEMACFRVAQEALTNVMRHAHAKQVWVALGLKAGGVQLSVRDDGEGFDVNLASKVSPIGGFGLIGMQERVRQLGGRLAIHSAPGRGTEVRASFPCEPAGGREPGADARTQA